MLQMLSSGTIVIMGLHGVENLYFTTFIRRIIGVDLSLYMDIPYVYIFDGLCVMLISYFVIVGIAKWLPWVMGNRRIA